MDLSLSEVLVGLGIIAVTSAAGLVLARHSATRRAVARRALTLAEGTRGKHADGRQAPQQHLPPENPAPARIVPHPAAAPHDRLVPVPVTPRPSTEAPGGPAYGGVATHARLSPPVEDLADTGRHRVPDGLLDAPTARIDAARLRVSAPHASGPATPAP